MHWRTVCIDISVSYLLTKCFWSTSKAAAAAVLEVVVIVADLVPVSGDVDRLVPLQCLVVGRACCRRLLYSNKASLQSWQRCVLGLQWLRRRLCNYERWTGNGSLDVRRRRRIFCKCTPGIDPQQLLLLLLGIAIWSFHHHLLELE